MRLPLIPLLATLALLSGCGDDRAHSAPDQAAAVASAPAASPPAPAGAPATPASSTPAEAGFVSLFNGTDLTGWEGNPTVWRVEDHVIVGGSLNGNPHNEFLASVKSYSDFILRFEYKLTGTSGFINSGMQLRSQRSKSPAYEMIGYQADIGVGWTGSIYDESRRNKTIAPAKADQIKRLEHLGDWNAYELHCQGRHIVLTLNGEVTCDYTEADASIPQEGIFGMQIHGGAKSEVRFRNVWIKILPPAP
jgi:hypothetical protein